MEIQKKNKKDGDKKVLLWENAKGTPPLAQPVLGDHRQGRDLETDTGVPTHLLTDTF